MDKRNPSCSQKGEKTFHSDQIQIWSIPHLPYGRWWGTVLDWMKYKQSYWMTSPAGNGASPAQPLGLPASRWAPAKRQGIHQFPLWLERIRSLQMTLYLAVITFENPSYDVSTTSNQINTIFFPIICHLLCVWHTKCKHSQLPLATLELWCLRPMS